MQTVEGFGRVYHNMLQQTILGGRCQSSLENYIRRIALMWLEFNRLPENISEDGKLRQFPLMLVENQEITPRIPIESD